MTQTFTRNDFLLLPTDKEEPYRERKTEEKFATPWGQRKLIISEIQFFTLFWDSRQVARPIAVYAGAAPGNHIPFLSSLFPQFEFHLYDPRDFGITESEKIKLHQQLFSDDDAAQWAGRDDVFFLSDIRTADFRTMTRKENEVAVEEDMRRQERWYNIIKPVHALLKMRPPYAYEDVPKRYLYLGGLLFKQVWAPQNSTETRLVPNGPNQIEYDIVKYGNQMFYQNSVVREKETYLDPLTGTATDVDPPELLKDWDSIAETNILIEYFEKMVGRNNVTQQLVVGLSRAITQEITRQQRVKRNIAAKREEARQGKAERD
jgi:cap2 methyltransferase